VALGVVAAGVVWPGVVANVVSGIKNLCFISCQIALDSVNTGIHNEL